MAYDYTGYGLSSGEEPSEEAVFADAEAALEYLVSVVNMPHHNIVLYGRSLGGGPSTYLAQKMSLAGSPPRGLVLQSPFLSAYRVAFHFRFSMPGDQFCNIDRIGDVLCPVYVIHGTNDEVVPFWNGQELFLGVREEFRYPAFWVKDAGHNNIELLLRDPNKLSIFFVKFREFLKCTADRRGDFERLAANAREDGMFSGTLCCGPRTERETRNIRKAVDVAHAKNYEDHTNSSPVPQVVQGGGGESPVMPTNVSPGWK